MDFYGFANDSGQVRQIEVALIDFDPAQPRRSIDEIELRRLADSMAAAELLQPISVYPVGDRFRVLVGERRLRAARLLQWATIDARVCTRPEHVLAVQLAENHQRAALQPWEMMLAVEQMSNDVTPANDIVTITGVSRTQINRYLKVAGDPVARALLMAGSSLRDAYAAAVGDGDGGGGDDESVAVGGSAVGPADGGADRVSAGNPSDAGEMPVDRRGGRDVIPLAGADAPDRDAPPAVVTTDPTPAATVDMPAGGGIDDTRLAAPAAGPSAGRLVVLAEELAARWADADPLDQSQARAVLAAVMDDCSIEEVA